MSTATSAVSSSNGRSAPTSPPSPMRCGPRCDGPGRVAAFEVLLNTIAVQNLIKEGKTRQLRNVLETGIKDGMNTMERSLGELIKAGLVDFGAAAARAQHPDELRRLAA